MTTFYTYQGEQLASVSTSNSAVHRVYTVLGGDIANALERHDVNTATNSTDSQTFYFYNHRGDVALVTGAGGAPVYAYDYDAYGNLALCYDFDGGGAAPTDDLLLTGKDLDPVRISWIQEMYMGHQRLVKSN